jgi:hypothetical protein
MSCPHTQVLAIRTSTLEEKATACNMIVCYLDELKEGFFPYVQEVRKGQPSLECDRTGVRHWVVNQKTPGVVCSRDVT